MTISFQSSNLTKKGFSLLLTLLFFNSLNYAQCNLTLSGWGSSNLPRFDTYSQVMAGGSGSKAINLQFNSSNSNCTGWKLTVRALSSSFSNGTDQISIQNAHIQFNSTTGPNANALGINTNIIPISTTEQIVIQNAQVPITSYCEQTYNLILGGGAQNFSPTTGIFKLSLLFTLYNNLGQVISTYTMSNIGFQYYVNDSNNFSLQLQNGGNAASFNFDNPSKLTNGISLTKPNSLKITTNSTTHYQVMVNSIQPVLTSNSNSYQIPISAVHLEASLSTPINNITTFTTTLSNNSTSPLIINHAPGYPHETVIFNLRYFINGNESSLMNAPVGTYSGILVFIAVPY